MGYLGGINSFGFLAFDLNDTDFFFFFFFFLFFPCLSAVYMLKSFNVYPEKEVIMDVLFLVSFMSAGVSNSHTPARPSSNSSTGSRGR